MKMGHFQDSEVHSTSRAKPVPWVAHTGELLVVVSNARRIRILPVTPGEIPGEQVIHSNAPTYHKCQ